MGIDSKSIPIITGKSYIGKGVESLLSQRSDMDMDSSAIIDNDSSVYKIENFHPNIIIRDERLLNTKRVVLSNLLSGCPKMRVLVLCLNDNRISIYDHQEIIISNSNDLVSTIARS